MDSQDAGKMSCGRWDIKRGVKSEMLKPPYDPRAVANLLLDAADHSRLFISNLALQKLLYFAHGHFLIQTGQPLVQGAFEAWKYGPVHPAVYAAFKASGAAPISFRARGFNVMTGESRPLTLPDNEDVQRNIDNVLNAYGRLSPGRLVDISHAPRGPWAVIVQKSKTSTALGMRIPDAVTEECFRYQKISVGVETIAGDPGEDVPLVA